MNDRNQPKENQGFGILPYLTAGVVSIVGAAAAAYSTVRDRFAKDIRQSASIAQAMKEKGLPTHNDYIADLESYAAAFINGDGSTEAAKKWSEAAGQRKIARADELMKFLGQKGFPSNGLFEHVEGILLRYNMMSPNSKRDVKTNAALTATVAFAGIMSYLGSTHMRHQMDRIENHLEQQSAEQSR